MSSLALAHLTREAAAGGEDAWRTLVALLDPMLHSIARGYRLCEADADDVVQITWGRALLHLDRLDDPGAVAGWLAVTARRDRPPERAPARAAHAARRPARALLRRGLPDDRDADRLDRPHPRARLRAAALGHRARLRRGGMRGLRLDPAHAPARPAPGRSSWSHRGRRRRGAGADAARFRGDALPALRAPAAC